MAFKTLDSNLNVKYEIEQFESIIWTDRYLDCGDFEIYTSVNDEILSNIQIGDFVFNTDSYDPDTQTAELMIVETAEITTTFDNGVKIKFTGRNLKSIMDRRIVWDRTTFLAGSSTYEAIKTLVTSNITNPTMANRKINQVEFVDESSLKWPVFAEDYSPTGQTVLDAINQICSQYELGYKMYVDFNSSKFIFKMIIPVDRTYDQTAVPPILFSAKLENLLKTNYTESSRTEKNVILVADEGDEEDRITAIGGDDTLSGLERKEMYASISNLEWEGDRTKYLSLMRQKGDEELLNNQYSVVFDGETDNGRGYVYGVNYFIGDVVELQNEFGFGGKARLTEMISSISTSGFTLVPTFVVIKE